MGYAEQARSQSHEALALAERFPHPFRLTDARYWASQLQQFGREPARVYELAEAVLVLATQQELAQQAAQGMFLRGWALMEQGQSAVGLAQMQQGFDTWQATGAEVLRPYYLALLAEALGKVGKPAEGLRLLTEALEAVDCSGERSWAAEVHRLKGESLLRQVDRALLQPAATEEAEAWLHRAIAIARHQEAKVLELRAAMSLARLWQQQGKRTEAQELLAPIYAWFTEGFDTADLQEARTLLQTLCI
jgi:predicted ATPase